MDSCGTGAKDTHWAMRCCLAGFETLSLFLSFFFCFFLDGRDSSGLFVLVVVFSLLLVGFVGWVGCRIFKRMGGGGCLRFLFEEEYCGVGLLGSKDVILFYTWLIYRYIV